jgi:hypothetical protein
MIIKKEWVAAQDNIKMMKDKIKKKNKMLELGQENCRINKMFDIFLKI